MEETIKNRIISILAILTVIMCIGWLSSCMDARQNRAKQSEEIAKRMDAEERLIKFSQEKPILEAKLTAMDKELQDGKAALDTAKKTLAQEQLVNQSIKDELLKVTKLKEALEENLKEALVQNKSGKPKK